MVILGPILFLLMINDLRSALKTWKYVDDVSIAEHLTTEVGNSSMQANLDAINDWSTSNWMKLNDKKSKELRICFFREKPAGKCFLALSSSYFFFCRIFMVCNTRFF